MRQRHEIVKHILYFCMEILSRIPGWKMETSGMTPSYIQDSPRKPNQRGQCPSPLFLEIPQSFQEKGPSSMSQHYCVCGGERGQGLLPFSSSHRGLRSPSSPTPSHYGLTVCSRCTSAPLCERMRRDWHNAKNTLTATESHIFEVTQQRLAP